MKDFKKLTIWGKAMELAEQIYISTLDFPDSEKYGLVVQMRRCAVSIPSNIAEGSGRGGDKDNARFVSMAIGSSHELETQVLLSIQMQFLNEVKGNQILKTLDELQKQMYKFRKVLNEQKL